MSEEKQMSLIREFEKEVRTFQFGVLINKVLSEFGVDEMGGKWVEIDKKEGTAVLLLDIAPKLDNQIVRHIINEVRPEIIHYERYRGDDWGTPARLRIPTKHKQITLYANVYVFDQAGGVWKKFNDVTSSGYRDVPRGTVDFYGGKGHFELIEK